MNLVIVFAMLLLPNFARADVLNQNRLSCLDSIKGITQKGFSTSFTYSEKVQNMSMKEFALGLVKKETKKNLMILPTKRNGERGFYVYADDSSFWYKLPKLKKNGEFLPLNYQISDKRISKSTLYLTYYDGVESNGMEYSNKSVSLTTQVPQEDPKSFAPMELKAIQDDASLAAFDENFRHLLSTVDNVRERANQLKSAVERKKMQSNIDDKLNDCLKLFKESKDDSYHKLVLDRLTPQNPEAKSAAPSHSQSK